MIESLEIICSLLIAVRRLDNGKRGLRAARFLLCEGEGEGVYSGWMNVSADNGVWPLGCYSYLLEM